MKPTVGRVMLYRNADGLLNASMVAFVHDDEGTLVNLSVIDASGVAAPRTSVQVFDGPQDDIPVSMCGWMDYQRSQVVSKDAAPLTSLGSLEPDKNAAGLDFTQGGDASDGGSGAPLNSQS